MAPEESNHERQHWNRRYSGSSHSSSQPDQFLVTAYERWIVPAFPEGAPALRRALDVAGGKGRHAIWLAERGWQVTLVDFSEAGLARARAAAGERGLSIEVVQADLRSYDPGREVFDLVMVFYFLEREALPSLQAALRPGGFFVYKTYTEDDPKFKSNPQHFFFKRGELRCTFAGFEILHSAEYVDQRAVAELVGRKRA